MHLLIGLLDQDNIGTVEIACNVVDPLRTGWIRLRATYRKCSNRAPGRDYFFDRPLGVELKKRGLK